MSNPLSNKPPKRYYIKQYSRCSWTVIGPSGIPLFDNAPHGKDKEIIFKDEDAALECAERCNLNDDGQTE